MKRSAQAIRLTLLIVFLLPLSIIASGVSAREKQASDPQAQQSGQQEKKGRQGNVELLHVQGNVYVIAGAGANITVQVGNRFVMVVDSGVAQMSEEVLSAIRSLTDKL